MLQSYQDFILLHVAGLAEVTASTRKYPCAQRRATAIIICEVRNTFADIHAYGCP